MPKWRRTESRVVRPFTSIETALKEVRFRLRADQEFDDRTSFDPCEVNRHIRPEFLLHVQVPEPEAERQLTSSDLSLVIKFSDPRLHRSELVFESAIDALPKTWEVPQEVQDRFSWTPGFIVSVALVLKANRFERKRGLPFMRGHWLARKDFSVRSHAERPTLPIERWTAEDFAGRGLPRDTVYWIEFLTEDLHDRIDDPGQAIRVRLRDAVYDALLETEGRPSGRAVAKMIEAEILTEVLWRGLERLESDVRIEPGSLLHSALAQVEKATKANQEALRQLVKQTKELSSLRSFAQAAVGAQKNLARLRMEG